MFAVLIRVKKIGNARFAIVALDVISAAGEFLSFNSRPARTVGSPSAREFYARWEASE